MKRYLLDTNIVSDLMRNPKGRARARLDGVPDDSVFTSVVVAAEIRFGAVKRNSASLSRQAEIVLGDMDIQAFSIPADQIYAKLRVALESRGAPIGAFDMLIAAHALAADAILVTDNIREFERVPGLTVDNWLRD